MKKNLTEELAKNLSIAGFKKKALIWRSSSENLMYILNIQKSRFNTEEETFTVNIAVFSNEVYELCWGKRAPTTPTESDGILRRRINDFCPQKGLNSWYVLKSLLDIPDVLTEIQDCINNNVLTFFNKIHNAQALYILLKSAAPPKQDYLYLIQLACLAYLAGDKENSVLLLDTVSIKSTTWKSNAEAVKHRIGAM